MRLRHLAQRVIATWRAYAPGPFSRIWIRLGLAMLTCLVIAVAILELPLRPDIGHPIAFGAIFLLFFISGVMGLLSILYRRVRDGPWEYGGGYAVLVGAVQALLSFGIVVAMVAAAIARRSLFLP